MTLRDLELRSVPREVAVSQPGIRIVLTVRPAEQGLVRTVLGIDAYERFGAPFEVGGLRGSLGCHPLRVVYGVARDLVAGAFEATAGEPFVAWMKGAHAQLYCRILGGCVLLKNIPYQRSDDCIVLFRYERFCRARAVIGRESTPA